MRRFVVILMLSVVVGAALTAPSSTSADGIYDDPQYAQQFREREAGMSIWSRVPRVIFTPRYFEPHNRHFYDDPLLLWMLVLGNGMIALAYTLIPAGLVYFVRKRRDIIFSHLFWLYGAFIVLCGATHVMMIVVFWYPIYWLEMILLWVTGIVSLATFFSMIRILPMALKLKSTTELEKINARLEKEVVPRAQAETDLKKNQDRIQESNDDMETTLKELQEKSRQLEQMNKMMIGRELKMEELKEEIKRLKGEQS